MAVVLDSFFFLFHLGNKKWSLFALDRWLSYTVTIAWEFALADSPLVVLWRWSFKQVWLHLWVLFFFDIVKHISICKWIGLACLEKQQSFTRVLFFIAMWLKQNKNCSRYMGYWVKRTFISKYKSNILRLFECFVSSCETLGKWYLSCRWCTDRLVKYSGYTRVLQKTYNVKKNLNRYLGACANNLVFDLYQSIEAQRRVV